MGYSCIVVSTFLCFHPRNNLLGCLVKDSPIVKLYDVTNTSSNGDDSDCTLVERYARRKIFSTAYHTIITPSSVSSLFD